VSTPHFIVVAFAAAPAPVCNCHNSIIALLGISGGACVGFFGAALMVAARED
jgi:hypothetical protein